MNSLWQWLFLHRARLQSCSSPCCLWNMKIIRGFPLTAKKTVLRLKPASKSHTLLQAWDSPFLVQVLLLHCEMWGNLGEKKPLALAILSFLHAVYFSPILHYGHELSLFHIKKNAKRAVLLFHMGFSSLSLQLFLQGSFCLRAQQV